MGSSRRKILSIRVDPIEERFFDPGRKQEVVKGVTLCKNCEKKL